MTPESSPVIFLLGAGASKDGGLPLVDELTQSFEQDLRTNPDEQYTHLLDAYEWLVSRLQDHPRVLSNEIKLDVELVLAALLEIDRRKYSILSAFITKTGWRKETHEFALDLRELYRRLRRHIRSKCEVMGRDFDYLRPLMHLLPQQSILDIFTVNYDASIEYVCHTQSINCVDGFSVYWDPGEFHRVTSGVRLHKLHGSVHWYETSDLPRRLVKIPASDQFISQRVAFFADASPAELLVYPELSKAQHVEPYATLLSRFREALAASETLVSIGYSFRDAYLKETIIEALENNPRLRLVVVSPDATDVLSHSDQAIRGSRRFEEVRNRVEPHHNTAGDLLHGGRLLRLLAEFQQASHRSVEARRLEMLGQDISAHSPVEETLSAICSGTQVGLLRDLLDIDPTQSWHRAILSFDHSELSDLTWIPLQVLSAFGSTTDNVALIQKKIRDVFVLIGGHATAQMGADLRPFPRRISTRKLLKQGAIVHWFQSRSQRAEEAATVCESWARTARWHFPADLVTMLCELAEDFRVVQACFASGAAGHYEKHESLLDGKWFWRTSKREVRTRLGKRVNDNGTPRSIDALKRVR